MPSYLFKTDNQELWDRLRAICDAENTTINEKLVELIKEAVAWEE